MSVFKACDIRGVVGQELDEHLFQRIGKSLGNMVQRRGGGVVCLGGDFRRSTPVYKRAIVEGLTQANIKAIDVGQMPTPMVYFVARRMGCPHVAIVTASHNPGQYNGLKFMMDGQPATPPLIEELRRGLDDPPDVPADMRSTRDVTPRLRNQEILTTYATAIRSGAEELVAGTCRPLKIIVDAMHGAMSGLAGRVLQSDGFEVLTVRDQIDPDFATNAPNPAADKNLQELVDRVLGEHADLGLAFDGDGDRVAVVDHRGKVIRPEQIGALMIKHVFAKPTLVYDQKCASVLVEAAKSAHGRVIMQPSGHGFIKSTMMNEQADLGVEVSGHYFFKALGGGDDGLFAGLVVARLVATRGESLANLIAPISWPSITPDLRLAVDQSADVILEQLATQCGGDISRLDGLRAEYANGWALARASITEPVMTFRFEAKDPAHLREIITRFFTAIPALGTRILEQC